MNSSFAYWVRTTVGLEKIVVRELTEKFRIKQYATSHRSVFFELQEPVGESVLCSSLRTADDIYRFFGQAGGIDNTKQSVKNIEQYFLQHILPLIPRSQQVRVTVSFLGDRNFNRYYVENLLNDILATQGKSSILSNENGDKWTEGETRIRLHIEDDQCYFGTGLQDKPLHRRTWRGESYTAQLHPPIAAAMAMLAEPSADAQVIDPYCGSGTILIESALQKKQTGHQGFDIHPSAIAIAMQNAHMAGVDITFQQDDFINHYKNAGKYILVTNPPWGEKHNIDAQMLDNLRQFIDNSISAVLLVPEDLKDALKIKHQRITEVCVTRVRGKLAAILHINPSS
jgi:tRNA (guanine6-N2)-methyltransferase